MLLHVIKIIHYSHKHRYPNLITLYSRYNSLSLIMSYIFWNKRRISSPNKHTETSNYIHLLLQHCPFFRINIHSWLCETIDIQFPIKMKLNLVFFPGRKIFILGYVSAQVNPCTLLIISCRVWKCMQSIWDNKHNL